MQTNDNYHDGIHGSEKNPHWMRIALVFVLLVFTFVSVGLPYNQLLKADKLRLEGKDSEAAELYSKYKDHTIWKTKATEGYASAMTEIAEAAIADHDYEYAIEVYRELGNHDRAKEVQLESAEYFYAKGEYQTAAVLFGELGDSSRANEAWNQYGDALLDSKEFEQAINAYTNAENDNKVKDVHLAWAEDLVANHLLIEALEHFTQADREEEAREIMMAKAEQMIADADTDNALELLISFKGTDVAELLFRAQQVGIEDINSQDAINNARKYGELVNDFETQLYYCKKLYQNNYDLKKIYPDGVFIDINLGQYQFFNSPDEDDSREPDYSGVIVLSREDKVPDLEVQSTIFSSLSSLASDDQLMSRLKGNYLYDVKLRPELMADLFDINQAWDLESCTAFVILDEGYLPMGHISIRTTTSSKYGSTTPLLGSTIYRTLIYYAAYGAITVYDRNHPEVMINYDAYIDYPVAANAVIGNSYSDSGIDLTGLQVEEIQQALNDRDSEASQAVLDQYDSKTIAFVEQNGWGDYILLPDKDENGEQSNFKGTADNMTIWNVPRYMLGYQNDTWMKEHLDSDAMSDLAIYFLFSGID